MLLLLLLLRATGRTGCRLDNVRGGYCGFEIWEEVVKDGGVADNRSVTFRDLPQPCACVNFGEDERKRAVSNRDKEYLEQPT